MEKPNPLGSRRFLAFLLSETTWKIIIAGIMLVGMKWDKVDPWIASIVLTVIVITGFLEVAFIQGLSGLEKYVKLAEIAANTGKAIVTKTDTEVVTKTGNETTTVTTGTSKKDPK
jgi:hypothetical protein